MALLTKKSREGYIFLDHRNSPGLPEDIALEAGFDPALCVSGQQMEVASLTCAHCGRVTPKSVYKGREYAECIKCDHYVCNVCAVEASKPDYVHLSFRQFVDKTADYAAHHGAPLGSNSKLLLS
jgi:hypothetical protein